MKYIKDNLAQDDLVILGGDFNDWRGYATKPLINILEFYEEFLSKKIVMQKHIQHGYQCLN